jgi:hypothetical protein
MGSLKRVLGAFLFLVTVGLGPLFTLHAASQLVKYVHKSEGYSMLLPSNWEFQEDLTIQNFKISMVGIRPAAKADEVFRENVNVVIEKLTEKISIQDYFDLTMKQMKTTDMLDSLKLVRSGDLQGANTKSKYMVYTHKDKSSGTALKVVVFLYISGEKAYSLTCTSTDKGFDAYMALFFKIGKSFKPAGA